MRFLTGDDTGIIKCVRVEAHKVERLGGSRRRGDAAERLCWAGPAGDREARVAVAYASGAVEARASVGGEVLGTFDASAGVRRLERLDDGLLSVCQDGQAAILANWCADEFPAAASREGADGDASGEGGAANGEGGGYDVRRFELPGPVADARLEPTGSRRLAFGGGENDVKIWDLAGEAVSWRAKNMRENYLCLRIPIKLTTVQWATQMAPSRSMLLCGTSDGKVRVYDAAAQRRPLLELQIGYKQGVGTAGYTGTADDVARPVNCSMIAQSHNSAWSIFVGNTMGVLREYDLRHLPTCKAPEVLPGRKSHMDLANKQLPLRRGYRGIMGSIRDVDVHSSGAVLAAVGLGRFAYVFETRRKKMISKVYLKQKLCSVLLSEEPYNGGAQAAGSDEEGEGDVTGDERGGAEAAAEEDDAGAGQDEPEDDVQEGFTSDEGEDGAGAAEDGEAGGEAEGGGGAEGGGADDSGDDGADGAGASGEDGAAAEAAAARAKRRAPKRRPARGAGRAAGGAARKRARAAAAA